MAKMNCRRTPFYLRREPKPKYDIRLLRPASFPLGSRFETVDVQRDCSDSEYIWNWRHAATNHK